MNIPVSPLRRALRVLLLVVLTTLAIPITLAVGAVLPSGTITAVLMLGVLVGAVARTLSWVAGEPTGERANTLAVTTGLGSAAAAILLAVVALFAGPVVLVLTPLNIAASIAAWWLLTT